jgi:magnesium transporter
VSSTGLFLFRDRLVIILPDEVPLFNGKMFNKIQSLPDMVLRLVYRSIFHFLEHLKAINAVSESLEQKINASMENRYLLNLFTLEKSLVYYLNAIHANGVVLEKLRNSAAKIGLTPENLEFLEDILIENNQCYRQAEIYSNILASMMDARASIVSNNLNVLMKTLNIITIMIMVPTLVVSAFSMNVEFPLKEHPMAFWIILFLATASALTVFIAFFWWKKW